MNIKSNIFGCLSYIGIAIEFSVDNSNLYILGHGEIRLYVGDRKPCGDSVCHYVLEYAEKPKAGRGQQKETQGMASVPKALRWKWI